MTGGRDIWWHDLVSDVSDDCPALPVDSENTLFILYTSGSTGKPKGIRHTTAGYNCTSNGHSNGSLIIAPKISIGARPIVDGSRGIATLSTVPCRQGPRR